nr:hypothetical protein BaRGS_008204 [Batillaria attramentaria]
MTLLEKGLTFSKVEVDLLKGDHLTTEFKKISPNKKVPAAAFQNVPGIEDCFVYESNVITELLDADVFGSKKLYPRDPWQRAKVKMWQDWELGLVDDFVPFVYQNMLTFVLAMMYPTKEAFLASLPTETPPSKREHWERTYDAQIASWEKLEQHAVSCYQNLIPLEAALEGRQFLVGDDYTTADLSVLPRLAMYNSVGLAIPGSYFPNIVAYIRRLGMRPSIVRSQSFFANLNAWLLSSVPGVLVKVSNWRSSRNVQRFDEDGAPHTEGVALMLAPEAQRALIGWEPVNSRIITAKFITKKKDIKLNIIQCYAPTNDAEEEKKDDFYQQLQTVIDRGGAKDMTILMGDFNAKIGSDNTGYEDTMGTHGLGQMNENGERFADFCALNQLVIGGSIFPHKRIHKATWRSPDHVTENQIDHICISRKFRRSWRDVRVMRGADVSSDHHLLATTLRLRLKRHTNANNTRTRYNVGLLRNTDTQAAFRISLSNRFQPLQDLIEDSEMDIETQWEHSKKLWHDTCEEVLGKRKTQHKEWISADTIQKLEVRKEKKTALNTSRTRRAKAKAQEEYTAADREVKRSTRKDKRDYIDNLASQAEEAARQGNLKDLYQVTKKLAGKFQQTDKPVKDKNGHPLTTTEEQLKRWAEHFRELLNRPIPETPPDIPPAETELPINCDKPSKAEIRKAIMTLRNGKAAGPDEIPAEAIKADTETAVNMLHSLFSKIWEKEEVPAQWKEGIVIKLPKKGDLRDCSNYRGIMLLSVPGKVLNRILLERMREAVDPMLRDQQAGFRRNRSCADQIASLRIIVEQSLEWNSPLYINFIDYEKAFDSVDREALWKLLRHYGVPGKIISLIQCTYQDMSCRIAHAGQLSESFEVKTGVRQGCLLSPFLFLLVIDWIMKTSTAGRKNGIQWTLWTQLDDLDFADDLALLSHSHSQMQDKTTCLEATSAGTGLKINRKKTELMKINTTANTPVTVGGEPIREVESFVYLGSVVDGQGGTDRDVTARIGKARAAMVMLKNVWASKVVSIRTKLRIFNSNVKSVLLYGCETWRTTKTMQQKIQTFLNTCLRCIFNIRWPEKIRNEELWERAGQEPVAKQILRRKWGWIGHTLRKPASSTTRQALTWNPQGKRKRGRPRNSWRRDTEAELCKQGTNWTGVARLAQNRGIKFSTSSLDAMDVVGRWAGSGGVTRVQHGQRCVVGICAALDYLALTFGAGTDSSDYLPTDPLQRARAQCWQAWDQTLGYMELGPLIETDIISKVLVRSLPPDSPCLQELREQYSDVISAAQTAMTQRDNLRSLLTDRLRHLEDSLQGQQYLVAGCLTLADLLVFCRLAFFPFVGVKVSNDEYPNITRPLTEFT